MAVDSSMLAALKAKRSGASPSPGPAAPPSSTPGQPTGGAPTLTIPDTLPDILRAANTHLVAMLQNEEPMDERAVPELQAFFQLATTLARRDMENDRDNQMSPAGPQLQGGVGPTSSSAPAGPSTPMR